MTATDLASPITLERHRVGPLLRQWRKRRHLSQLDLALKAEVSSRHLSFVENGRSRPTRLMILHLSEHLDVPLRDRNELLLAGGYAPAYSEHRLDDLPMASVDAAIRQILDAHRPYPALVVDRRWNLVAANDAVGRLVAGASGYLLEPPVNVLRLSLHPDGMAPRIANLRQWRRHLLERLGHQVETTGDGDLAALLEELAAYPHRPLVRGEDDDEDDSPALVVPLRYRAPAGMMSLLSTTTVFGAPHDVTVSELAIESFYPTDAATEAILRGTAGTAGTASTAVIGPEPKPEPGAWAGGERGGPAR